VNWNKILDIILWALSSEIKLVLFLVTISALLGFTQVPIAEGEISWNGFLKEVGFPMEKEVISRSEVGTFNPDESNFCRTFFVSSCVAGAFCVILE